jgi:hypothetical protein
MATAAQNIQFLARTSEKAKLRPHIAFRRRAFEISGPNPFLDQVLRSSPLQNCYMPAPFAAPMVSARRSNARSHRKSVRQITMGEKDMFRIEWEY